MIEIYAQTFVPLKKLCKTVSLETRYDFHINFSNLLLAVGGVFAGLAAGCEVGNH